MRVADDGNLNGVEDGRTDCCIGLGVIVAVERAMHVVCDTDSNGSHTNDK